MRLLCDANIGSRLSNLFAGAGHDVVRSINVIANNAPDSEVLAEAVRDGRVLITSDADFGELVFMSGATPPPAIVYIRFRPSNIEDIALRVIAALERTDIEGHMIVVGRNADRMTKFPERP